MLAALLSSLFHTVFLILAILEKSETKAVGTLFKVDMKQAILLQ